MIIMHLSAVAILGSSGVLYGFVKTLLGGGVGGDVSASTMDSTGSRVDPNFSYIDLSIHEHTMLQHIKPNSYRIWEMHGNNTF